MQNDAIPYHNLTPDVILGAVESVDLPVSGGLLGLNSYENRVYQVGLDDTDPVIVKFYRPGRWSDEAILEEHAFSQEIASHEIPVVPPFVLKDTTLHHFEGYRFAVFPRKGGRTIELDNFEHLQWIGRFIGRLHAIGAVQPFYHRPLLDSKTCGDAPHEYLLTNNFIPSSLQMPYRELTTLLYTLMDAVNHSVGTVARIRLHGDCHAGNILVNSQGLQIVDLDDCLMGPAIQDLWMLIADSRNARTSGQLNELLVGYTEFYDFDYREIRLIENLRTLRIMQYASWLAKRWNDPAFPLNFPWFNTDNYWQDHFSQLQEQAVYLEKALEI